MVPELQKREIGVDRSDAQRPSTARCYDAAINELKAFRDAANRNREDEDPLNTDERWDGFLQGINGAIGRLLMHNAS